MNIYSLIIGFIALVIGIVLGKTYFELSNMKVSFQPTTELKEKSVREEKSSSKELPLFIKEDLKAYGHDVNNLTRESWNEFIYELKTEAFKERLELLMFNGNSLLHYIASSKELKIEQVQELVTMGFNINRQNNKGESPLNIAMQNQRNPFMVEKLIKMGALLDDSLVASVLKNKNTRFKERMLKYLQQRGYDYKDDKYFSELLRGGNEEYLKEYLKTADLNRNISQNKSSFEKVLLANANNDIIEYYLDNGVRIGGESNSFNELHASMRNENISIRNIQRIIDAGADVNARVFKASMTPLMYAVGQKAISNEKKLAKVELLLKNGADIRLYDSKAKDVYDFVSKIENDNERAELINLIKKYEE